MPPSALRHALRRLCLGMGILAFGAAFALRVRARTSGGEPLLPLRQEAAPLRVLTWNVGKIYLGGQHDSRAADADLARIANVIREVSPDLVALQELRDRAQLDRLMAELGDDYVGHVPEEEVHDRRAAALARVHRRGVRAGVEAPTADGEPQFSQIVTSTGRAAAVARVTIGAHRVTFVSVHLDAFDSQLRRIQAEEIVDWSRRAEDRDIILAGDFNFDADFLQAAEPDHPDVGIYRLLTASFQDAASGGPSTTIVDRRLDYLFTRGRLRRRQVRVLDGRTAHFMDHEPVVVDLECLPAL